jgi:hypothetical protein
MNHPLGRRWPTLARRFFGRATQDAIAQMTFAVIDPPFGAVRRHLAAGAELPGRASRAAARRFAACAPGGGDHVVPLLPRGIL